MKKLVVLNCIFIVFSIAYLNAQTPYPFVHIPGMFDNGDNCTSDNNLTVTLNNEDGFYYINYFTDAVRYDKAPIECSSNIVGSKYNRFVVANLIGTQRTNIALDLMAKRFYCLMKGRAPRCDSYAILTAHKGMDYRKTITIQQRPVEYYGLIENLWLLYGKKVYLKKTGNKYRVLLEPKSTAGLEFIENQDGYFDNYRDIKVNIVAHSSGGLAIREYIRMVMADDSLHHINSIINLSIPQRGATITTKIKPGFNKLIDFAIDGVFKNKDSDIEVITASGRKFTYKEIIDSTLIDALHGDNFIAMTLKKLLTNVILYLIPFDGHKNFLGTDPALWDLNPNHRFVKRLNKTPIPPEIKIVNYKVLEPFAKIFVNIGQYTELGKNDGAVAFNDTDLSYLLGFDKLTTKDVIVDKANHIPFPYIKPLFELNKTLDGYYPVIKVLIHKPGKRADDVELIEALMLCVLNEFGFNMNDFFKLYNYSVIDYFAENPVSVVF